MAGLEKSMFAQMEKQVLDLFTFEQHFFFLNGPRSTGKTYTLQKILMNKGIKRDEEIGYVVRTQDEYKSGAVWDAFQKTMEREFPDLYFEMKNFDIWYRTAPKGPLKRLVVGLPLSGYQKYKKKSFPRINNILFDEYMIEMKNGVLQGSYFQGYNEPEVLLNLYHTIDRDENRVNIFFLGNNTQFYNPYHIFPAFKDLFSRIPEKGQIVKRKDAVFWRVNPSPELEEYQRSLPFARALEGTKYYNYAILGEYQDDVANITKMPGGAQTMFGLRFEKTTVFVHLGYLEDGEKKMWLSCRGDPNTMIFACRGNDVSAGITLFAGSYWHSIFKTFHGEGNVYFADQKTKTVCQDFLYIILSSYRK